MGYATFQDIQSEFKNLDFTKANQAVTLSEVNKFLQEADAVINSYLGTRYTVPISGTAPVAQSNTLQISTVADATDYTTTIDFTEFKINSGIGATATSIRDLIFDAINATTLVNVSVEKSGSDSYVLTSKTAGTPYSLSFDAGQTQTATTANVLGDDSLKIIRKIAIDLVACRIAKILKVKVAQPLGKSGVRQDILDASCMKNALALLKDLQSGKASLGDDSLLISSGGGLESYGQANSVEPEFKRFVNQW